MPNKMSGEVELGACEICEKQSVPITRRYYHYDIDCDCCGDQHFEYVRHCEDCRPKPPPKTVVYIKSIDQIIMPTKAQKERMKDLLHLTVEKGKGTVSFYSFAYERKSRTYQAKTLAAELIRLPFITMVSIEYFYDSDDNECARVRGDININSYVEWLLKEE